MSYHFFQTQYVKCQVFISFILLQIINHEKYNKPSRLNNDIALLKLKTKLTFKKDNKIAPICLPSKTAGDFVGVDGTVTGWGTTSYGKKFIMSLFVNSLSIYYVSL